jgi:NSS family neurotransmitter:Na+ symporter
MASVRGQFSSRLGFVLAAAGAAVGLGNIWGFPTQVADNGGAAFVLVYLVLTFFLAFPVFMAELLIGRYGQANYATSLEKIAHSKRNKRFGLMIGFGGVTVSALIFSFYAILAGWMMSHATEPVARIIGLGDFADWSVKDSPYRSIIFSTIFVCLTLLIVQKGVEDGIEKWSKRLMPLLILLLISLAVYVLTLEGASEGLEAYLKPDFSGVFEPDLLASALGQSFFSLGVGAGLTVTYASYLSKTDNLVTLGAQVTLIDVGMAVLAGLLIIPAMYVAQAQGMSIFAQDGSLISGPRLVFNVLPNLFVGMGSAGLAVSFIFFLLMSIAALTSSIAILEMLVVFVCERYGLTRKKASVVIAIGILSLSTIIVFNMGWLFGFVIMLSTEYMLPFIGFLSCLFVGWVWHRNEILQELRQGYSGVENSLFWKIWPWYIKFVCPAGIALVVFKSL